MKSKILKMMGVLLVLSLMLMAMPAPMAAGTNGLSVTITAPSTAFVCDTFPVIVTASSSDACYDDVVLSIEAGANAEVVGASSQWVGDICNGKSKSATFMVHCTHASGTLLTGTATYYVGCSKYTETGEKSISCECRLGVVIDTPTGGTDFVESDTFSVTATVTNNTDGVCENAVVCLGIDGNASLVPPDGEACFDVGPIPANDSQVVNWTVHCDGPGDVDLTVTATGCGQVGEAATACADTITIYQRDICGLEIELDDTVYDGEGGSPIPTKEVCVCDNFWVKGTVTNTGDFDVTSGTAYLTITGGQADFPIADGDEVALTKDPLTPGDSEEVWWKVHCDGRAADCEYPDWVSFEGYADGTCQDSTVTSNTDTLPNFVNQKWLIVDITSPVTCTDVCVGEEFDIHWTVENCYDQAVRGDLILTWTPPSGASIASGPGGAGVNFVNITIPANDTFDSSSLAIWHFDCLEAGPLKLHLEFVGIAPPGVGLTLCDWDEETIHQKDSAKLAVDVDEPKCVGVCTTFDVVANVTNPGGIYAAPVENVNVVMTATGGVLLIGTVVVTGDTDLDNLLDQDETWVYTWTYTCDDYTNAHFSVTVTGDDPCDPGDSPDLTATDTSDTIQLDVGVNITSPPTECAVYQCSDTFCVTADIINNDEDNTTITIDYATIEIFGAAVLADGETASKAVGEIVYGDATPEAVSWTVHCTGPGPADIVVTAHVTDVTVTLYGETEETVTDACECLNFSDSVTVYQVQPPVTVEILSPPDYFTYVATSQDFAVSVEVTNIGDFIAYDIPVTVALDPVTAAAVVPPPEATQIVERLDPDESVVLTWTLHCEEQGVGWISVTAVGETAVTDSVYILQYPAAHLEVVILGETPTSVTVCDEFTVYYQVKNTGEADATEVEAILSVTPLGSVRPVEGIGSGYTQYIGTIPAGGETEVLEWDLHCKVACESTIVITAEGNDEYGWHKKQQCESTGSFEIVPNEGLFSLSMWSEDTGEIALTLHGITSGLIGAFNLESYIVFTTPDMCCSGWLSVTGYIDPATGLVTGVGLVTALTPDFPYVGPCVCDPGCTIGVTDGLFHVENGLLEGYLHGIVDPLASTPITLAFTNGLYCSTMASTPGMAIITDFIEPASVTVKQLEADADLAVTKTVDVTEPVEIGTEVTFTVTLTNLGPSDATSIYIWDLLPAGLNYVDDTPDQGYYYVSSGYWDVGDLANGGSVELDIIATVNTVGAIENLAAIDFADQHDPVTTNNAATATVTGFFLEPEPVDQATITVVPGWNLISLPIIPGITAPHDIPIDVMTASLGDQTTDQLDMIYGHDPEGVAPLDFPWYDPVLGLGGSTLLVMEDGYGYWVLMLGTGGSFNFDGWELVAETDPPSLPPSYAVVEGWNLIGFKSTTPKPAVEYLAGIAGKYVIIYGYEGGSFFIVGSPGHEFLQPGLGYWIALKDGEFGTIFP